MLDRLACSVAILSTLLGARLSKAYLFQTKNRPDTVLPDKDMGAQQAYRKAS